MTTVGENAWHGHGFSASWHEGGFVAAESLVEGGLRFLPTPILTSGSRYNTQHRLDDSHFPDTRKNGNAFVGAFQSLTLQ